MSRSNSNLGVYRLHVLWINDWNNISWLISQLPLSFGWWLCDWSTALYYHSWAQISQLQFNERCDAFFLSLWDKSNQHLISLSYLSILCWQQSKVYNTLTPSQLQFILKLYFSTNTIYIRIWNGAYLVHKIYHFHFHNP